MGDPSPWGGARCALVERGLWSEQDACGGYGTASLRFDQNFQLTDRLSIREYQEILATALLGGVEGKAGALGSVAVNAGAGVYLDVSSGDPVRRVRRTTVTGEKTEREEVNPGPRVRWMILDASGRYSFVDSLTDTRAIGVIKTGMSYDF